MKDKKDLLKEATEIKNALELRAQINIGIMTGVISGLLVIIFLNFQDSLLETTGNVWVAFIGGIIFVIVVMHLIVERPLNKLLKRAEQLNSNART